MAFSVQVEYRRKIDSLRSQEETFAFLSDVSKSIEPLFPGLESLRNISEGRFEWMFQKLSYGGADLQIRLVTEFQWLPPGKILVRSEKGEGLSDYSGHWIVSPSGSVGASIDYLARMEVALPLSSFLKAVAVPIAQKELNKLLDRYTLRVAQALQ